MFLHSCLTLLVAATTPPWHAHQEYQATRPDGGKTRVRVIAQDESFPLEGTRWWIEIGGRFHRLDSYGFETNYGPLYQSPDGGKVIAFRTFRNTVDAGLCFDLVTGEVTHIGGEPAMFEAEGWKLRSWQEVDQGK